MIIVTAEYPFSSPASFSKPFNSYAKASSVKRSEKGYGDENIVYSISFSKAPFTKCFFVHKKTKSRRFQILPF